MSHINEIYPVYPINQCIAKTANGYRCKKRPIDDHFLCHQHHKATIEFFKNARSVKQQGGDPVTDIYKSVFSVALPSCIDILQCDWITDVTSAIPGLTLLIKLMSY